MRYLMPDPTELTGGDSSQQSADSQSVEAVPTGMDNDPNADEDVINQQTDEEYPRPVDDSSAKLASDDLADSIAYALDGTGPGPMREKPNVSGHDVIIEGSDGTGSSEEQALFGK